MGKRGKGFYLIVFSIAIVLMISFVSAGFLGDLLGQLLGIGGGQKTQSSQSGFFSGEVIYNGYECTDSDGVDNFNVAGFVLYNEVRFDDYCSGEVAYDYNCGVESQGIKIALPLIKEGITGRATSGELNSIDEPATGGLSSLTEPPKTSMDCAASNLDCLNGKCGCVDGYIGQCNTGMDGLCANGSLMCVNGAYVCKKPGTPEVCYDEIDNDCDGSVDENCNPSPTTCTDIDGDLFSLQSDPLTCSNICNNNRFCLGGGDCDDNNASIHPGAAEICGNGVDEDCSGADLICPNPLNVTTCTDSDGDGYKVGGESCGLVDCDDSNAAINPGATEICDGIDNNCVNGIDEGLDTGCSGIIDGECVGVLKSCSGGVFNYASCTDIPGFSPPEDEETCGDDIDNNCDGSIDEGCSCLLGSTNECDTGDACSIGEQTCQADNTWSSCQVVGTIEDCDPVTSCTPPDFDFCGTNIGICFSGSINCQEDGTWGECTGKLPEDEICADELDNDCDTFTDEEDCITLEQWEQEQQNINQEGNENTLWGSNENEQNEQTQNAAAGGKGEVKGGNWLSRLLRSLFNILRAVTKVGQALVGFSVSDTTKEIVCLDSDGGKSYYLMGRGSGLSSTNEEAVEVFFEDFCYQDNLADRVEKCAGTKCFLVEYICDEDSEYFDAESNVKCPYGCADGACIPDPSLNEKCKVFDKDTFELKNIC